MATFTITTPINIDELSTKAGGDTYNINGGTLTIDQDSRYGQNQFTTSSLGPITISATLGGALEVDARYVRIIPFDTGQGVVPACNTLITQGGASGKLIGVYSALNVAPTAFAAQMPTSGYIKIKQWNEVEYTAGALGNITANATGPSRTGWIELTGDEASGITASRLGTVRFRGEWFSLGVTDGTPNQTFQIPSNGLLQYVAGIFIEKSVGSNTYEFYPSSGVGVVIAHKIDIRAKFCYMTNNGVVRLGNNTSVNAGYVPTAGLKVVIPNIICNNNTTAARTANVLPSSTLGTRYETATTGGPTIIIDKATIAWYLNIGQAYSVTLSNMATNESLNLSEIATPMTITNVGVGQTAAQGNIGLALTLCYAGGTFIDCVISRASMTSSGHYIESFTDIDGFTFNNHRSVLIAARASAQHNIYIVRGTNCIYNNLTLIGAKIYFNTSFDCEVNSISYIDNTTSVTTNAVGENIVSIQGGSARININGPIDFMNLPLVQPYAELIYISASYDCNIRNIGTKDEPLDLGGTPVYNASWTRSSTTATITSPSHGLVVNSAIYVFISSDTAAITLAAKAIVATATADTFTFACLNAGAASGTLSYVPSNTNGLYIVSSQRIKFQRIYMKGARLFLTGDNSNKNIIVDNVQLYGPMAGRITYSQLALWFRGRGLKYFKGAGTGSSVYGTHWTDIFESDIPSNTTNLAWTRSSTTATVTMSNHGYSTGQDFIVSASSNEAAIPLGYKSTLSALTANTFTFTCANAGAASGTLSISPIKGEIMLNMNEPISQTASQVTIESGTPSFTSAGTLYMPTPGQQVLFETPYYIIGHTGFTQVQARLVNGGTITNHDILYAIDKNDGNGYSEFKNLNLSRRAATGASGAYTCNMMGKSGIQIGDYVYGTGIRHGAQVTEINGFDITLSLPNTATVSGILSFNAIPNETGIDATKGFKLKVRIITISTNTTAIGSLNINTECTEESRKYQYILDTNTVTFTGLPTGTDAVVLSAGTNTVLDQSNQIAGTSFSYVYSGAHTVDVGFIKPGYKPFYIRNLSLLASDSSIPVALTIDRSYI